MNKKHPAIFTGLCILLGLLICLLVGTLGMRDPLKYRGDYPGAFTVLANSVEGMNQGDLVFIELLETDSMGRTMYACIGDAANLKSHKNKLFVVVILQKTADGTVCYIKDKCFLSLEVEAGADLSLETVRRLFPEEVLARLKADNDWNEPLSGEWTCIPIKRKIQSPALEKATNPPTESRLPVPEKKG